MSRDTITCRTVTGAASGEVRGPLLVNPVHVASTLYRSRFLLWAFTARSIHVRHRGSYLGLVWIVLNPLLVMLLFTFVFGIVFKARYGVVEGEMTSDFALGIFLSLSIFYLVSDAIGNGPKVIVDNPNFVKKVVFPLETLPAAVVGASVFNLAISLAMVLVAMMVLGNAPTLLAFWLPVIVVPVVLLSLGACWLVAALGVFFRDIAQFTQVLTLALLYGSAVFFSTSMVPRKMLLVLQVNPLLHAIEQSRNVLLWKIPPDGWSLGYLYVTGILVFIFGFSVFKRLQPTFGDAL